MKQTRFAFCRETRSMRGSLGSNAESCSAPRPFLRSTPAEMATARAHFSDAMGSSVTTHCRCARLSCRARRHVCLVRALAKHSRLEENWLPYRDPASNNGAVDPGLVVAHPNDRFQYLRVGSCRVGVEVHHRAALVVIGDGDGDGGTFLGFSERQDVSTGPPGAR